MQILSVLTILSTISNVAAADMLKPQLRTTLFGRSPIIDDSQPSQKHSTWRDVDIELTTAGVWAYPGFVDRLILGHATTA